MKNLLKEQLTQIIEKSELSDREIAEIMGIIQADFEGIEAEIERCDESEAKDYIEQIKRKEKQNATIANCPNCGACGKASCPNCSID